MSACKTCGANAGLMSTECKDCAARRKEAEANAQVVQRAAATADTDRRPAVSSQLHPRVRICCRRSWRSSSSG